MLEGEIMLDDAERGRRPQATRNISAKLWRAPGVLERRARQQRSIPPRSGRRAQRYPSRSAGSRLPRWAYSLRASSRHPSQRCRENG